MDGNPNFHKPCDDFYQFACGGFLNSQDGNPLTKSKAIKFIDFTFLLKQKIEENDYHHVKLAKIYYQNCILAHGNPEDLINFEKAWPITKKLKKPFNFNRTTIKINEEKEWINMFFDIDSESFSLIRIAPNELIYQIEANHDKMTKLASSFYKGSKFNARIEEIIRKVWIFGIELLDKNRFKNLAKENLKYPSNSRIVTFDELKKKYGFFDWEGYINHLRGTPVQTTTKFLINNIVFMNNLKHLLKTTKERILVNFLAWMSHENDNRIIDELKSNHCFYVVSNKLPMSLLNIYYQNLYLGNKRDKNQISEIFFDIKEQVLKMVDDSTFIDNYTRVLLLQKLESLKYVFEFSQILSDNSNVDKFYENLNFFETDNFIDINKRITIFDKKKALNRDSYWGWVEQSMLDFNAYHYCSSDTCLIVYSPLYQNVDFHENNPMFANYGTIGRTFGHEIVHALQKIENAYDHYGNEQRTWTVESVMGYNKQCSCLIEQYGNYKLPKMIKNVDGKKTLEENIADHGGIKAAYRAYIKKLESSNNDERLPGINYTPRQMFWISYAQAKCQKVKEENLHNDVHAPPQFRVNGPLSNMEEFSNDFNCPTGSNMNPMKKCTVW